MWEPNSPSRFIKPGNTQFLKRLAKTVTPFLLSFFSLLSPLYRYVSPTKNTILSRDAELIRNRWSNKFILSHVCFNLAIRRSLHSTRTRTREQKRTDRDRNLFLRGPLTLTRSGKFPFISCDRWCAGTLPQLTPIITELCQSVHPLPSLFCFLLLFDNLL